MRKPDLSLFEMAALVVMLTLITTVLLIIRETPEIALRLHDADRLR